MILSANGIMKAISDGILKITPFDVSKLNTSSYDVTLGNKIGYYPMVNCPTCYYGQVDPSVDPDRFGHMAALPPEDPSMTHMMSRPYIDLAEYIDMIVDQIPDRGFLMYPGNVYLVNINEEIDCRGVVAEISGKSKIARAGLEVHLTAGYGNLGDTFKYTLELKPTYPTMIYPNMRIAQIRFHTVEPDYVPGSLTYTGTYSPDRKTFYKSDIVGYFPDADVRERAQIAKQKYLKEQEELAKELAAKAEAEAAKQAELAQANPSDEETAEKPKIPGIPEGVETIDMGELGQFAVVTTEEEKPEDPPHVFPDNVNTANDGVVVAPIKHEVEAPAEETEEASK